MCLRLDKILISSGLINAWNILGLEAGQRDVSNHCPVWLKCEIKDWGPKPFRFIHGWFDHKDFLEFIENE